MMCASPLLIPQHTEGEKSVHERIKEEEEEEEERRRSVLRFESWLFWVVVVVYVVVKLWWYSRYYEVKLFYSGLFFEHHLFSPKERKKYSIRKRREGVCSLLYPKKKDTHDSKP